MGAVRSTLSINDGMTSALRRINKAMSLMLDNFEAVQRASGQAVDTQCFTQARQEMGRANAMLDEIEKSYNDINNKQESFNRSLNTGTSNAGNLLSKLKGIAATYLGMQTIGSLVELSDTQAQTEARLSLIVDDKNSIESLEAKIRASAERGRASYQTTADAVSKLGMQAGAAFKGNDELVAFTELLNKSFVVAGTSAQGVESVMLQITQAMAAGRLQGEELNAVLDNAQPIVANIQRYLEEVHNINAGNIKNLASEGVITADVIKNAMFYCAEDINGKFNEMPTTWSQVWTMMKDKAILALDPLLQKIGNLTKDPQVQNTINGMIKGFGMLANMAVGVFGIICSIYSFMSNNWSIISPIIYGIAIALAAYNAALFVSAIAQGIKTVAEYAHSKAILKTAEAHGINTAALGAEGTAGLLAAAGLTAEQVATAKATTAQAGFNTALLASPITWVIAGVIALVVVFGIFTEQIMGAIFWLGALFKNIGLWLANCGLAAWQVIKNIGAWLGNLGEATWAIIENVGLWFANLGLGIWNVLKTAASNVATAFSNGWINIQIGFWRMLDSIMQGLKTLANKANECLGWMGVNIDTSGLDFASKKIDELNNKKGSYKDISDAWNEGFNTFTYNDVGSAWNTHGYGSVGDAFNTFDTFQKGWGSEAYNAGAEVGAGIKDWMNENLSFDNLLGGNDDGSKGNEDVLKGMGDSLGCISDDTSGIAGSLDKTTEELEYLRDIAEREAINRFTTAEVKVDLTSHNNINSNLDLDGVISYLAQGVEEALVTAAEGVY